MILKCRLCSSSNCLISVFSGKSRIHRDYIRKLTAVTTGIKFEKNDVLNCICFGCVVQIYNFYIFRTRSLHNEEQLQSLAGDYKKHRSKISIPDTDNIILPDIEQLKISMTEWLLSKQMYMEEEENKNGEEYGTSKEQVECDTTEKMNADTGGSQASSHTSVEEVHTYCQCKIKQIENRETQYKSKGNQCKIVQMVDSESQCDEEPKNGKDISVQTVMEKLSEENKYNFAEMSYGSVKDSLMIDRLTHRDENKNNPQVCVQTSLEMLDCGTQCDEIKKDEKVSMQTTSQIISKTVRIQCNLIGKETLKNNSTQTDFHRLHPPSIKNGGCIEMLESGTQYEDIKQAEKANVQTSSQITFKTISIQCNLSGKETPENYSAPSSYNLNKLILATVRKKEQCPTLFKLSSMVSSTKRPFLPTDLHQNEPKTYKYNYPDFSKLLTIRDMIQCVKICPNCDMYSEVEAKSHKKTHMRCFICKQTYNCIKNAAIRFEHECDEKFTKLVPIVPIVKLEDCSFRQNNYLDHQRIESSKKRKYSNQSMLNKKLKLN